MEVWEVKCNEGYHGHTRDQQKPVQLKKLLSGYSPEIVVIRGVVVVRYDLK